jgi:hypothetical protein
VLVLYAQLNDGSLVVSSPWPKRRAKTKANMWGKGKSESQDAEVGTVGNTVMLFGQQVLHSFRQAMPIASPCSFYFFFLFPFPPSAMMLKSAGARMRNAVREKFESRGIKGRITWHATRLVQSCYTRTSP